MNFTVKPNFKEVGKVFGKNIKEYTAKLLELTNEEHMKGVYKKLIDKSKMY